MKGMAWKGLKGTNGLFLALVPFLLAHLASRTWRGREHPAALTCAHRTSSWLLGWKYTWDYNSKVGDANLKCFFQCLAYPAWLTSPALPSVLACCLQVEQQFVLGSALYLLSGTTKETWRHAGTRTADHELKACTLFIKCSGSAKEICWGCFFPGKKLNHLLWALAAVCLGTW